MSREFRLTGLREQNPQGWMAAVGILRILDELGIDVQLVWEHHIPVLHGVSQEEVMEVLTGYLKSRENAVQWNWADNPSGIKEDKYREILEAGKSLEWLAVYLPHGIGGGKGVLDLTAGRLELAKTIRQTIAIVQTNPEKIIAEALTGPWLDEHDVASLGWAPTALKRAALISGEKPPDQAPHLVVAGAQWLAAEALPITGTRSKAANYEWVTWAVPLDLESVTSVVLSGSTHWGGTKYISKISRNGSIGYLEPARTRSNQEYGGGSRSSFGYLEQGVRETG